MERVDVNQDGIVTTRLSARYWTNLEGFPGQLYNVPEPLSARQETVIGRRDAVRMGRAAQRGVEHIRGGVEKKTDMVTGPRLFVQPTPDWDILDPDGTIFDKEARTRFVDQCTAQFNNWAYDTGFYADAEGHGDFGQLMWLAYLGVAGAEAECFGIIHYDEERQAALGCNWATTVQMIATRRLQSPPTHATDPDIFEGRQLDRFGRAVGFYVARFDEGDQQWTGGALPTDYAFVPRQTITGRPMAFHYFEKDQPAAQRGLTKLATIVGRTSGVDTFYTAFIQQAVLRSIFAMYAKTMGDAQTMAEQLAPEAESGISPFERKIDFYKAAKIRVGKAGRLAVLPPGDELKMEAVGEAIADPAPLVNLFLREYASSTGTSFAQISKNFSQDNYAAARMAIQDVWSGVVTRRTFFASAVPAPIYGAVIEEAIERQRVELPAGALPFQQNRYAYTRSEWTGPAMPEADPLKAAQAMEIRLRTRTSNRQIECAERGTFYYDIFKQHALEVEEAEELGFELEPPKPGEMAGGDQPGQPGDGSTDGSEGGRDKAEETE